MGHTDLICEFCKKEYTNKSGYSNHICRCPKNPNRVHIGMTTEGRVKSQLGSLNANKRWNDPTERLKQSDRMKMAVSAHPESYTSSNRGRTKQIEIDGIKLQGQWEVEFYLWAKENNLTPMRPLISFNYVWQGERQYHPDFYLPTLDLYIEVKGYETDRDRAKWSQFPEKLAIIKSKEIDEIRKGVFKGPLIQR